MEISKTIYAAPQNEFDVAFTPDVVYAHRVNRDLTMQIFTPIWPAFPKKEPEKPNIIQKRFMEQRKQQANDKRKQPTDDRTFPAIIFVPGSGWAGAEGYTAVGKIVDFAKKGFVIASISYRGTFKDDVRYPAAVQDAKEAIRYLRANADIYHIDVDRIGIFGGSSGGHTAAAAALTGDEERFNIGDHLDQRTDVRACALFYAPNDLLNLVSDRLKEKKILRPGEGEYPFEAWEIFQEDFLQAENPNAVLADASPINYITADKKLPAFLFLNGDDDPIIPLAQGLRFCERVRENGGRAEFVKIAGAKHGTGCWSKESVDLIVRFFETYLV